jgi:hypothetical protein
MMFYAVPVIRNSNIKPLAIKLLSSNFIFITYWVKEPFWPLQGEEEKQIHIGTFISFITLVTRMMKINVT